MRRYILIFAFLFFSASVAQGQIYGKLNGLYALGGVINPQVEMTLSPHSTFQVEIVYSPWRYVNFDGHNKPENFGIFLNEYKYYFKEVNNGWYVCMNVGMMAYHMTKPTIHNGKLALNSKYGRGWGFQLGVGGGYQYKFCDRWLLDAFFSFGYMNSKYNSYILATDEIEMYPARSKQPDPADPWNGSGEWLPNKIGLSIGYLLFKPAKK